jgi:hypothetical protein
MKVMPPSSVNTCRNSSASVLNLGYVARDAGGNGSHAVLLEKRDGQLHKLGVERLPDIADRKLAYLREKPDASKREKALKHNDRKEQQRNPIDVEREAAGQCYRLVVGCVHELAGYPRKGHKGAAAEHQHQ